MDTVGQIVRKRREALGLTLSGVAASVGVAKSYLSMIENHRVGNPPSSGLLDELERALGITPGELRRAADWQSTPEPIRQEVQRLSADADRGRELAAWLKSNTVPRKSKSKKADTAGKQSGGGASKETSGGGGVGKDLDALYRSGQLSKRINAILDQPTPTQTDADANASSLLPTAYSLPPTSYRVPLINRVAAGHATEHTDLDFPDGTADQYLDVPDAVAPDSFSTVIAGQSMLPKYEPGDIVVCSASAKLEDGCDCFVRLEPDHESTFKRVYFDEAEGTIRLQPLNPDFPPRIVKREQVAGLYRAVGRYSKL
ncbi:MAG: LexA family transcriptional regulator [Planctomycetota bacterium]